MYLFKGLYSVFVLPFFTTDSENEAITLSCNERNERSDIGAFG